MQFSKLKVCSKFTTPGPQGSVLETETSTRPTPWCSWNIFSATQHEIWAHPAVGH